MAKFLDTNATSHYLNQLVKNVQEKLVIISPYLKLNDRMKDLLRELDMRRRDIRVVFGKSELAPQEMNWLHGLESVRTFFSKNLHAKCYLNEREAIITSMNLYEFSQVNNIEMGIWFTKEDQPDLYRDVYEEVDRIIVNSESVRMTAVPNDESEEPAAATADSSSPSGEASSGKKLSTSKIAKGMGLKTAQLNERLLASGYVARDGDRFSLTAAGERAGGEPMHSKRFGDYIVWPSDLRV